MELDAASGVWKEEINWGGGFVVIAGKLAVSSWFFVVLLW
jgi:hypothetical protein